MNIKNRTILVLLSLLIFSSLKAQEKYWVFFTDKEIGDYDPYSYLDKKAIQRRINHNVAINDFTDWPVNKDYLQALEKISDSVTVVSRWLNAVVIYTNNIKEVTLLPFVKSTRHVASIVKSCAEREAKDTIKNFTLTQEEFTVLNYQTQALGGNLFKEKNFTGKGIRIAVFDVGFMGVDKHPAFKHLRSNNQIIKTHDFVGGDDNVYMHGTHGTSVLSCITGKIDKYYLGLAVDAEFLLARTERKWYEYYGEEENWVAAAEWADKNGADIINSSLGYTFHRYFKGEMDGKKSLVARVANMAASKGILVVNAAGNEGDNRWRVVSTPADADSVLAVGGTDPNTNIHVNFSSFGPTSDYRIKPNVCAPGIVIVATPKSIQLSQGTSFSSPLVAGFAACIWQADTNLTNMELFKEIEQSGSLSPYYDYAHGYGIPKASYFINKHKVNVMPTFTFTRTHEAINVVFLNNNGSTTPYHQKTFTGSYYFKDQGDLNADNGNFNDYFYYHIADSTGKIIRYFVLDIEDKNLFSIERNFHDEGNIINAHYKGYSTQIKLNNQ